MENKRIFTFSVKPTDKENIIEVEKLSYHSSKTGISFSYLILKAIKDYNEKIKVK